MSRDYPCEGVAYPSQYQAAVALEQEIVERGGMIHVARQPRTYRCVEGHFHNEVRWRRELSGERPCTCDEPQISDRVRYGLNPLGWPRCLTCHGLVGLADVFRRGVAR